MLKMTDKVKSRKHGSNTVQGFLDWVLTDDSKTARIGTVILAIQTREEIEDLDDGPGWEVLENLLTLDDLKSILDDPDIYVI